MPALSERLRRILALRGHNDHLVSADVLQALHIEVRDETTPEHRNAHRVHGLHPPPPCNRLPARTDRRGATSVAPAYHRIVSAPHRGANRRACKLNFVKDGHLRLGLDLGGTEIKAVVPTDDN